MGIRQKRIGTRTTVRVPMNSQTASKPTNGKDERARIVSAFDWATSDPVTVHPVIRGAYSLYVRLTLKCVTPTDIGEMKGLGYVLKYAKADPDMKGRVSATFEFGYPMSQADLRAFEE